MPRPTLGELETRSLPGELIAEDRRLRGVIPYGRESRDLGGWREVIEPGALNSADLSRLVVTVNHEGVPLGRHPGTLEVEDRDDGMHWACDPPRSRADILEAVERGDVCDTSWRMIVKRDRWEGEVRHIHEISALRDVALVTTGAYPEARAELRHAPEPTDKPTEEAPVPEVEETREGGGLQLESRSAESNPGGSVEHRFYDALRGVPRGESRSLTLESAAPVEPQELSTYLFDQLRPESVVLRSGVRVVSTDRKSIKWPTLTGDVLADDYGELDPIDETDPEFDEFEIEPRAIKALVKGSSEAFEDSSPDLLQIVEANLRTILALKLDWNLLQATTATQKYEGLLNVTSRQTLSGATMEDHDWWIKAVGLLAEAHVPGPYAWIAHPRVITKLGLLKEWAAAEANVALPRPVGMPDPLVTSQLPLTEGGSPTSSIIVYAPAQCVFRSASGYHGRGRSLRGVLDRRRQGPREDARRPRRAAPRGDP